MEATRYTLTSTPPDDAESDAADVAACLAFIWARAIDCWSASTLAWSAAIVAACALLVWSSLSVFWSVFSRFWSVVISELEELPDEPTEEIVMPW